MISYVVDLDVDSTVASEYSAWLREHVREMLSLPGFLDAEILQRLEPEVAPDRKAICVHYRLRDEQAFRDYLRERVPRMREAGLRRFGEHVRAHRGVLQSLD